MSILAAWHSGITKGGGLLARYLSFAKESSEDTFRGTSALILTVDETSPEVIVAA